MFASPKTKQWVFHIIQPSDGYLPSRIFDLAIMALIFISVLSVFVATFSLPKPGEEVMAGIELASCVILMLFSSLLMYHAEHGAQPDKFRNAFSGLWWAVATLTTVGYGDIYPVTAMGRLIGAVIAILGIGMVAIPTSILSSGFLEHFTSRKQSSSPVCCPHCGQEIRSELNPVGGGEHQREGQE